MQPDIFRGAQAATLGGIIGDLPSSPYPPVYCMHYYRCSEGLQQIVGGEKKRDSLSRDDIM